MVAGGSKYEFLSILSNWDDPALGRAIPKLLDMAMGKWWEDDDQPLNFGLPQKIDQFDPKKYVDQFHQHKELGSHINHNSFETIDTRSPHFGPAPGARRSRRRRGLLSEGGSMSTGADRQMEDIIGYPLWLVVRNIFYFPIYWE